MTPQGSLKPLVNDPEAVRPSCRRPSQLSAFLPNKIATRPGAVAPDGRWLASGDDDGEVIIWKRASGWAFRIL